MNITLVTVGKIKETYLRDALHEYKKRLTKYCHIKIIEVADEKVLENASEKEKEKAKEKEGEGILKSLKEEAFIVTLEIQGEMLDSVELAEKMQSLFVNGYSHIQFVIGGSLGLSKSVIKKGNLHLSFSKMTFPHQLMRVLLLEQIYRGFRIIHGEPYHK